MNNDFVYFLYVVTENYKSNFNYSSQSKNPNNTSPEIILTLKSNSKIMPNPIFVNE